MQERTEILKDLIMLSDIKPQIKLNMIIQTLQKTDANERAKMMSERIIAGDFSNLKDKAIENLIKEFKKLSPEQLNNNTEEKTIDEDEFKDNKTQNLEYELREMKLKMESLQNTSDRKCKELENKNKELENRNIKLMSKLVLTNNSELIQVDDKNINELYIKYLENGDTVHEDAFIMNNVIPKAYYKIEK